MEIIPDVSLHLCFADCPYKFGRAFDTDQHTYKYMGSTSLEQMALGSLPSVNYIPTVQGILCVCLTIYECIVEIILS